MSTFILPRPFVRAIWIGLFMSSISFAQPAKEIQWAGELLTASQPKTAADRAKLIEQILEKLKPHAGADREIRAVTSVLELQLGLLQFDPSSLSSNLNSALSSKTSAERLRLLQLARVDLVCRAAYLTAPLVDSKITVADAQRLSQFVKYASQVFDDLRDPSVFGGRTSDLTRLATRLDGIAKLAQSVEDPAARTILGGLRGTIGTIDRRIKDLGVSVINPMRAFEIPAEVASSIVDTSRKGMDESAAAINEVGNAISGDPRALDRLADHAKRIETILSPENYGRQMSEALAKRVSDRIPFVRTLAYWFTAQDSLRWLVGKWKTVRINDSNDVLIVEFRYDVDGVSGYILTPNKYALDLGHRTGDKVYRYFVDAPADDPLLRTYTHLARGQCLYTYPEDKSKAWTNINLYVGSAYGFQVQDSNCAIPWSAWYSIERMK